MKKMLRLLPIAAFLLLLTTATANAQSHEHMGRRDKASAQEVLQPRDIDGVQIAKIEIGKMGYSATRIELTDDMPVRLIFTRTVDGGCAHRIQIPELGVVATDIPLNEPTAIEFTPKEGEYTFACGMDMMKGMLLVKSAG